MEKINSKFLNYAKYNTFLEHLNDPEGTAIPEDAIVFIQDKRCIWARGKFFGDTQAKIEDGKLTLTNADGDVQEEIFVTSSAYSDQIQSILNAIQLEASDRTAGDNDRYTKDETLFAITNATGLKYYYDKANTYTKTEVEAKLLEYYKKPYIDSTISSTVDAIESTISSTASALQSDISDTNDRIDTLIGEDTEGAIDTFNEIKDFLEGIEDTTLEQIIDRIDTSVASEQSRAQTVENDISGNLSQHVSDEVRHITANERSTWNNKQGQLVPGNGIIINGNNISADFTEVYEDVEDTYQKRANYVQEGLLNLKLEYLQLVIGDMFVLKKDIATPDNVDWSEPTIVPMGDKTIIDVDDPPAYTVGAKIIACSEEAYQILVDEGTVELDAFYILY